MSAIDSPVEPDFSQHSTGCCAECILYMFVCDTDRPTGQAPVIHHSPTFSLPIGREGPFVAANPHSRIGNDMEGCAYWSRWTIWIITSPPTVPGVGGCTGICPFIGPDASEWIQSLSLEQTIDAAWQLQHDACLMTSNLNILDQNVLCLQGTASKILELTVGRHDFPSTVMESAAPVPCVCRASIHMEAMGLWRPPLGPDEPTRNFAHPGPNYSRPFWLQTIIARLAAGSCSAGYGHSSAGLCWILLWMERWHCIFFERLSHWTFIAHCMAFPIFGGEGMHGHVFGSWF